MFYQRKKFEEKRKIENLNKNVDEVSEKGKNKKISIFSDEKKEEKVRKKLCPRCGKYLDENHKTNLITDEEFFRLKEEMEKISYGKLLESDRESNKIADHIKKRVKEEFYIEEEIIGYKQAHHLISRTDVFFNNKDSAIIALSAGYDVNCIENGIILPTDLRKYKQDWSLEDKFRVMSSTKRQLHSGHHNFNLDLDSKVVGMTNEELKKIPKQNYSSLASKEFRKVLKKFDERCFINLEEKKEIIDILNKLSLKIREDIEKFAIDPKSSNFYVSKAALQYAFSLAEKRYEFIKVDSFVDENNILAEKYQIKLDYKLNSIALQKISEYKGRYNIEYLKFCADNMIFLYKDNIYFLKEDLNITKLQPIHVKSYSDILKNERNIVFEFVKEIERYLEGEQIGIRELIAMRKKNIV